MTNNNKLKIELDLEEILGLKEPNKNSLDYDLNFVVENGIDKYLKQQEDETRKDKEFVELFKRNYYEMVKFISTEPKQKIAVDCLGCRYGGRLDLSKQYGKPKRKE